MFFLPAVTEEPADLVLSASDIVAASECEYGAMRALDVLLGRIEAPVKVPDEMLVLLAAMGDAHERDVLDGLRADGVCELEHGGALTRGTLTARHEETMSALAGGHQAIYQASFFDGTFHGRADFLLREADGSWSVNDTKLARSPKKSALLQLAAYADQLAAAGVQVAPVARLILGNGEISRHELAELLPAYRGVRNRLEAIAAEHRDDEEAAAWGDRRWSVCLHCPDCLAGIDAADDLMQVRLMNASRRAKLIAMGIDTMTAFAQATLPKADNFLRSLHEQAKMQTGIGTVDGHRNGTSYKVMDANTLALLPAPSAGDIFFDFEGDPLYTEPPGKDLGLEYLFGLIEHGPADLDAPADGTVFTGYTAHSRAQEKVALIEFITHVQERRKVFPDLHVYHYANYEVAALRRLAARHEVMATDVEELVEAGVLFDLFVTVKTSLRISDKSLSIKKLEPLYMEVGRSGVSTAVDSITQYSKYRDAATAGDTAEASAVFEAIRAYNEYDCVSTLRLRDWLAGLAAAPLVERPQ